MSRDKRGFGQENGNVSVDKISVKSGKEEDDMGFTKFVSCHICDYPYVPRDGEEVRDFWITSCGHTLCNGSEHNHQPKKCTFCGKSDVEAFSIDQDLPIHLRSWFTPASSFLSTVQSQIQVFKFQYGILINRSQRSQRRIDELNQENEQLKKEKAEVIAIFNESIEQVKKTEEWKLKAEQSEAQIHNLTKELSTALAKVVALTENQNQQPHYPMPPQSPFPQMGYQEMIPRPGSVVRPSSAMYYSNGYQGVSTMPTVYETNEDEGYFPQPGHELHNQPQMKPNGSASYDQFEAVTDKRRRFNNEVPEYRSPRGSDQQPLHHRSQGGSFTPNPVRNTMPARLSLRPSSTIGERRSVKTNLERYKYDSRKTNATPSPSSRNGYIQEDQHALQLQDSHIGQSNNDTNDTYMPAHPSNGQQRDYSNYQTPQASTSKPRLLDRF